MTLYLAIILVQNIIANLRILVNLDVVYAFREDVELVLLDKFDEKDGALRREDEIGGHRWVLGRTGMLVEVLEDNRAIVLPVEAFRFEGFVFVWMDFDNSLVLKLDWF